MTIARRLLVDRESRGVYHCVSRCVRQAFLCGEQFEHRKDWVRDRLRSLTDVFAVDVGAYAVMSNHLHLVIRTDPQRALAWSPLEVVRRWARLFPGDVARWESVAELARDSKRIEVLRRRLRDLSWFMKCLKEHVARRANREDRCTGCFWEGRFRSYALLDDAAVLSCMVYVDLNVVRAALARTPEESNHTSVQDRIHARQRYQQQTAGRRQAPKRTRRTVSKPARSRTRRHAEEGIWLAPIEHRGRCERARMLALTVDEYLHVVDSTGRATREGKSGAIPEGLAPILDRLEIDSTGWIETMTGAHRLIGTAVGSAASRAAEAARRGTKWVIGVLDIYPPGASRAAR